MMANPSLPSDADPKPESFSSGQLSFSWVPILNSWLIVVLVLVDFVSRFRRSAFGVEVAGVLDGSDESAVGFA